MGGGALALPNDFAGLKLNQSLQDTTKFMQEKGHNIIYPDGKVVAAPKPVAGQLCTFSVEPLLPKKDFPAIETFNCGVVKGKEPNNPDRVIDTYIVSHYAESKSDEKAFYLTFLFNLKTIKPAGAGLIGKLGEPDTVTFGQACPSFIVDELKLKKHAAEKACFNAVWLPDGSDVMASVVGFGKGLTQGKIGRLEIWNMALQKKVDSHKASKAASELGF